MFFFLLGSALAFLSSLTGSQFRLSSLPRTALNTSGYSLIAHFFFIFSHSSSVRISAFDLPSGSFALSSSSFSFSFSTSSLLSVLAICSSVSSMSTSSEEFANLSEFTLGNSSGKIPPSLHY